MKQEKKVKLHRRLKFIQYKNKGINSGDIAAALDVCIDTLTNWTKLFLDEGFEGLCRLKYEGRRKSGLDCHKEAIRNYIQEKAPSTLAEINDWLEKSYGLSGYRASVKKTCCFPQKDKVCSG